MEKWLVCKQLNAEEYNQMFPLKRVPWIHFLTGCPCLAPYKQLSVAALGSASGKEHRLVCSPHSFSQQDQCFWQEGLICAR